MKQILSSLLILAILSGCATDPKRAAAAARVHRAETLRGTFGTYDNEPRLPNQHVDVQRLIAELVDQRANTYNWLVWHNPNDWADLKAFLPLARRHHIQVWISLVPPSEAPPLYGTLSSEPFRLDYECWAEEIGKLSRKEPALVAWSIDDFSSNLGFFTPAKLGTILERLHHENPKTAFVPCWYYPPAVPAKVEKYRDLLDGVLFPFLSESTHMNLNDPAQVEFEVNKLKAVFGPSVPIVVDVYATPYSTLPNSSPPPYVEETMKRAHQFADGVLMYCHQHKDDSPVKYELIKRLFHEWTGESKGKGK